MRAWGIVAIGLILVPVSVRAQRHRCPPDLRGNALVRACDRFAEGVRLFDAAEHEAALAEFDASFDLEPTWQAGLNAARCLLHLARPDEAAARLTGLLTRFGDHMPAAVRADARSELEEIGRSLAQIVVVADPPDAVVLVDDHLFAAGEPRAVTAGDHQVTVRRDGYLARTERVRLRAREQRTLRIRLERDAPRGAIDVVTTPPGADVYVDDERAGVTPYGGNVAAGDHEIRLELDGYSTETEEVSIAAGELRRIELELSERRTIFQRAWFWALFGAVVVGTAGTWLYLFETRELAPEGSIGREVLR